MTIFFLYILKCCDNSYYIGHTDNIEKRMAEHSQGIASKYTAKHLPITLVYLEKFQNRTEAFNAERKLKKWNRLKKEIIIKEGWEQLQGWKKRKNKNPSTRFTRSG